MAKKQDLGIGGQRKRESESALWGRELKGKGSEVF